MSRTEARAYYDKQAGDPDAGYIVPSDAQSAIDVIYRDMESEDQKVLHQLHNRVPDFSTADPGAVLMLEGPGQGQTNPVWSDNLDAIIIGQGSPLNIVVPDFKGQEFVDTQQTLGARKWVATDTTAASWVVSEGNTGWLDISGLLVNGWTRTGNFLVSREGPRVNLWASFLVGSSATADLFATLPAGFRTHATNAVPVLSSGTTVQQVVYNGVGALSSSARTATLYIDVTWRTSDPWPTAAPV